MDELKAKGKLIYWKKKYLLYTPQCKSVAFYHEIHYNYA